MGGTDAVGSEDAVTGHLSKTSTIDSGAQQADFSASRDWLDQLGSYRRIHTHIRGSLCQARAEAPALHKQSSLKTNTPTMMARHLSWQLNAMPFQTKILLIRNYEMLYSSCNLRRC